jgi:hypothetical protein
LNMNTTTGQSPKGGASSPALGGIGQGTQGSQYTIARGKGGAISPDADDELKANFHDIQLGNTTSQIGSPSN